MAHRQSTVNFLHKATLLGPYVFEKEKTASTSAHLKKAKVLTPISFRKKPRSRGLGLSGKDQPSRRAAFSKKGGDKKVDAKA